MADNYTIVMQQRTVQVLSQTQVLDVQQVGAITHPHEVYFETLIPLAAWLSAGAATYIEPVAYGIESILAAGTASGAQFVQTIDVNGLLVDSIQFTISLPPTASQPGPMSTTATIPVYVLTLPAEIQTPYFDKAFGDARAALQATAGL